MEGTDYGRACLRRDSQQSGSPSWAEPRWLNVTSLASSMKGRIIALNRGGIKRFCFAHTFMLYFGIIIIFAAVRIVQNLIGK